MEPYTRNTLLLSVLLWLVSNLDKVSTATCPGMPDTCECQPGTMTCSNLIEFPGSTPENTTELIFRDCQFGVIPQLEYMYIAVQKLIIENSGVTDISDHALMDMGNLTYLRIANNKLSSIRAEMFLGLVNLTKLDLEGNQIGSLPPEFMKNCPLLQSLNISFNPFLEVADDAFDGVQLRYLTCKACTLLSIPAAFLSHQSLEHLDLSINTFRHIEKNTFTALFNLVSLDLESCQVTNLPEDSLKGLKKLQQLWLNNNQLVKVSEDAFEDFQETIQTVRLETNLLKSLPEDLFPGERLGEINLFLGKNRWKCDCSMTWVTAVHQQPGDNVTCAEPAEYRGQNVFNVSAKITNDCVKEKVGKRNLAWVIGIPVLVLIFIFICYYLIKKYRKKQQQAELRKRGLYSGVYQDPVESTKQPLTDL